MNPSVSLPNTDDTVNPVYLNNLLSAANAQNNMTTPRDSAMIQNPEQPACDIFSGSDNPMAVVQSNATAAPGNDASSSTRLSPSDFCKLSSDPSSSNHSVLADELDDLKTAAVDNGSHTFKNRLNNSTASQPSSRRTRSSTSSNAKQRQTQEQTQSQAQNQEQQRATRLKKTPARAAKSSGSTTRKPNPRSRSLERNRIAASKCRQKKKVWLSDLEANKSRLERQYKSLHGECNDLLDDVAQLKDSLITHSSCNDPNIDGWINSEANKYIHKLSCDLLATGAP